MMEKDNLEKMNFLEGLYESLKINPIDNRQICVEVLGKKMIFEYNITKMLDEIMGIEPGTSEEKIKEELNQYNDVILDWEDIQEAEMKESFFESDIELFISDRREIHNIILERVDDYFNSSGEAFEYIMNFIDATKTPTEIEKDIDNIMKNVLDNFISAEIEWWWDCWIDRIKSN